MKNFIVRAFLQGLCAVGLCLFIYGRAHGQELDAAVQIGGLACLTPEDVEKVIPIAIKSTNRLEVGMEAAKQNIGCIPVQTWAIYKGITRTITIGADDWQIIHFQNREGADLYSWRFVEGEAA